MNTSSNRLVRRHNRLLSVWLGALCCCLFSLQIAAQPGSSALGNLTGDSPRPRPLPLEQAFPWFVSELESGHYRVTWTPASGHYLYRHAFAFSLRSAGGEAPLSFQLPPGLPKTDQFFGDIEAYYDDVSADLDLPDPLPADAVLVIEYQGCAEWGFCYPPQAQEFPLLP